MKTFLEQFSQNLKSQLEDFTEQLLDQIKEIEKANLIKDAEITRLTEIVNQSQQEVEELKKAVADKQTELDRYAQMPDYNTNFSEADPQLIIIYQPQDIFNYPRNIIRWYFNEVDFSRFTFEDLAASFRGLLEIADCEILDEIIYYLSDSYLDTMKQPELPELLNLLSTYLEVQYKNKYYSPSGIYYFLESLHKKNWTGLLRENGFVQKSMSLLEDLIFQIDDSMFTIKEPLTLLKIYFDLSMHANAKLWLERIIKDMVPDEEVDLQTQIEFLYLAFCYQMDNQVLAFFPEMKHTILNEAAPELKIYNIYTAAINKQITAQEAIECIQGLRQESPLVKRSLRKIVYEQMLQRLQAIRTTEEKEPQQRVIENSVAQIQFTFEDSVELMPKTPQTNQERISKETYADKWSDESALMRLGYNTTLSNMERWDILLNRALPKLGYQRVCQYLKWFIEQKSKIKQKDYSRAIAIWQMDLKRLNQYMIKHNKIKAGL